MIKKLLIILIKYIPVIQMMGMLLNNIAFYFNVTNEVSYTFDFLIGNSIITTFRRWMQTMIGNGIPIDWYEIV